jgi:replicative DNA helicase
MASGLKDKIPPHNIEAEQATLGALLQDKEAVPVALQFLRADDFYSGANSRIFEAVLNLNAQKREVDMLTVTGELRQTGKLDESGGLAYVASLTDVVPTSANIDYYARQVQDCSLRRSLIRLSNEVIAEVYDESRESSTILEETQGRLFELTKEQKALTFKSIREILPKTIEEIELHMKAKGYTGIPSGLKELDEITSGFQTSDLIIIAARPSVGKTALALTMADHIAITQKIPAAFFTLEMPDTSLTERLLSCEAGIEFEKIRKGKLKPSDFTGLLDAAGRIYEAPFYIVDMPNMKLLDLRAQARRLRIQMKVEIIFVDYLTLISHENQRLPRYEQIADISRSLKSLARELEIPIVVLSQLNREAAGKKPALANIRESGSIEQDADIVMFLHRNQEDDKKDELPDKPTELIIEKHRNGKTGKVDLMFLSKFTKFAVMSRDTV